MIVQGNVGQPAISTIAPGTPVTARLGGLADLIITELQGRYFEKKSKLCISSNHF